MPTKQSGPSCTPSWVGGLMDPTFLRRAIRDAHGGLRDDRVGPSRLRVRWQAALHMVLGRH